MTATPREPRNRSIWSRIRAKWFVRDLILVSVIALVIFGVLTQAFWFLAARELDERVLVEVPEGASVRRIATILAEKGLVRDPDKFVLATRVLRQTQSLQAGTYEFGPEFSELEVILALKYGEVAGRHLTVPEGYRASQIAALLDGTLDVDPAEFMELVHDPELMSELGVSAPSLEGFLHPDTYRFRIGTTAREAIVKMVRQTSHVFNQRRKARADTIGMSMLEVLTLASIVESEAMLDRERPRIAAVYHNRLEHNWRLEADPTVRYALGNYRRKLYYTDLDVSSPYNTYRRTGLPPGPICSPGGASIDAVLYPRPNTEDFFFVANGDGTHAFSRTFDEHIRARNRAARAQEEPTDGEFSLDSAGGE